MLIFPDEFKPVGYPKVYLYTLIDPRTNEIRYVGKTNNPEVRHKKHCNKNMTFYHTGRLPFWLNDLIFRGYEPIMIIVDYYEQKVMDEKSDKEKLLIEKYLGEGCKLLNISYRGKNAKKLVSRR